MTPRQRRNRARLRDPYAERFPQQSTFGLTGRKRARVDYYNSQVKRVWRNNLGLAYFKPSCPAQGQRAKSGGARV